MAARCLNTKKFMTDFDLVIESGEVFVDGRLQRLHIGVKAGKIAALSAAPLKGHETLQAEGRYVLPGGVDAHCHIAQTTSTGLRTADDFYQATVGAAFGGTTMVMPFAAQHRGQSLRATVEAYKDEAAGKAVVDYAFHMILTNPSPDVLLTELPALVAEGFTSIKLYMTYDALRLDDRQVLETLLHARRLGVLTMVHAENHDVIGWLTEKLLAGGFKQVRYLSKARPALSESEATHRAMVLADLLDTPIYIVHVSSKAAVDQIAIAQRVGLPIFAETCPQYLLLTEKDLDRPSEEAIKYCCSPPPRNKQSHEALWHGLQSGLFSCFSSDHSAFRLSGPNGKNANGDDAAFNKIPFGIPGLETRLPLLFSEGVNKGRISLQRFVELTASEPAKLFGLEGRKGVVALGADADLVLWDPNAEQTLSVDTLHDDMDYTVYEGMKVKGLPRTTVCRGNIVCHEGRLLAQPGDGHLIACDRIEMVRNRPALDPWLV
jgi:dihydropyrimidinase